MNDTFDFSTSIAKSTDGNIVYGRQIVDIITCGIPVYNIIGTDKNISLTFDKKECAYRILPENDISISFSGGIDSNYQKMMVMIIQKPISGFTVDFSTPVMWINKPPFIDSTGGAVTFFEIWTMDGGKQIYGKAL